MIEIKPEIFAYIDFRLFLKEMYEHLHNLDKTFSKSFICKQLGLPNSRSYFQDVLNGKVLTPAKMPIFAQVFGLNKAESIYFRILVTYNQATDFTEKEFCFDQIITLAKVPHKVLEKSKYEYYSKWYHSLIRSVITTFDFKDNYKELVEKMTIPLSLKQVKESIKLLQKLDLIEEDENGFFKPSFKSITTGSLIENEVVKQYQLKILDLSKNLALKNEQLPQRVITKMLSMSEEGYNKIIERLEGFNKEVDSIVANDTKPEDRVYQFNLTVLPYTKGKK